MQLKDFTPGQTVYLLSGKYVSECKVKSIGRKYITVSIGVNHDEKFAILNEKDCYLIDTRGWGDRGYLFTSKEAIEDYKEQKELKRKLCYDVHSWTQELSLDQLRRINE